MPTPPMTASVMNCGCYPTTEADSCPSAPLALKAACWQSWTCAYSLHSNSEDLHMYKSTWTCCCWPSQMQRTAWTLGSVSPCLPERMVYSREAGICYSLAAGEKKSKYLLKNNRARIAFSLSRYTRPQSWEYIGFWKRPGKDQKKSQQPTS